MAEIRQTFSRGIQEDDVWGAADVLLHEGLRPTIERVRLKIGRGSPNTVSPMLERWFASLGQRLAGGANPSANLAAGDDANGVPVSVRNATRLLWETARREAEDVQRQEMESARAQLEEATNVLAAGQAQLAQREAAFEQARASLDAALASSQQAREALERQLAERTAQHLAESQRLRDSFEKEVARLNALLQASYAGAETLRREHTEALAVRDKDLRDAEQRHSAQERRMLEEVDRARQTAKQLEGGLAREQQRRIQSEEAAVQTLEAGRRMLRKTNQAAQQVERDLRDQLTSQASLLAQSQSEGSALRQRQDDLVQLLSEEKESHEGTRGLLASALANTRKPAAARRKSAKLIK